MEYNILIQGLLQVVGTLIWNAYWNYPINVVSTVIRGYRVCWYWTWYMSWRSDLPHSSHARILDLLFGFYTFHWSYVIRMDVSLFPRGKASHLPPVFVLIVDNLKFIAFCETQVLSSTRLVVVEGDISLGISSGSYRFTFRLWSPLRIWITNWLFSVCYRKGN